MLSFILQPYMRFKYCEGLDGIVSGKPLTLDLISWELILRTKSDLFAAILIPNRTFCGMYFGTLGT